MVELKPGQLVRSLAGRDKNKHYLVLQVLDNKYVLLVDGRGRPLERPKKKNRAHLQHYERSVNLEEQIKAEKLDDSRVIKILKELVPVTGRSEEEV